MKIETTIIYQTNYLDIAYTVTCTLVNFNGERMWASDLLPTPRPSVLGIRKWVLLDSSADISTHYFFEFHEGDLELALGMK